MTAHRISLPSLPRYAPHPGLIFYIYIELNRTLDKPGREAERRLKAIKGSLHLENYNKGRINLQLLLTICSPLSYLEEYLDNPCKLVDLTITITDDFLDDDFLPGLLTTM